MKHNAATIGKPILVIRIILALIVFFGIMVPVYYTTSSSHVHCDSYKLDEHWDIRVNDTLYEDKTLSKFRFDLLHRGDYLVCETTLPLESAGIKQPILGFVSQHSVVNVYLNHTLLYSYGAEDYAAGDFVGYGPHNIPLPPYYVEKTLRIECLITENHALSAIQPLTIKDGRRFILEKLSTSRVTLAISFFLIICGVLFGIFSLVHIQDRDNFVERFCIAVFSFLIGMWSLCNTDFITLIVPDLKQKVSIEYMCFYTFLIPFTYYFRPRITQKHRSASQKMFFFLLLTGEITFAALAIACSWMRLVHFYRFLVFYHILLIVAVVFVNLLFIVDLKQIKLQMNPILFFFFFATVMFTYELVCYNISKYTTGLSGKGYSGAICYSSFLIVASLMYDFEKTVSNHVSKKVQQELLLEFAYSDSLSGLSNRRKCEETLKLFTDLLTPYIVISLDMNFLKKINDTYGHHVGDQMITDFSQVLQEVFGTLGTVGRMGGDEFIVILPNVNDAQVTLLLQAMDEQIELRNAQPREYQLSCASGFASSEEVDDSDFLAAYKLADERMYENKRKSRLGRT